MTDRIDDLSARVQAVEEKVDKLSASVSQLSASVDQRFASVDQRFDAVDAALREQREYTEFCYSRLESKVDAGFGRLERKLDQFIDVQLQANQLVDRRLRALEQPGLTPDVQP
jgi:uncharacterized protein YicC (UPF0701 family)